MAISLEATHVHKLQQEERFHELLQEVIDIRERKTLPIYTRQLSNNHPFTATIQNSLSVNYYNLGDLHRAKKYSEESLKTRQEVLKDHMDTAKSLFDLAMMYKTMKKFPEAKEHFEKCKAMQKKVLDDNIIDLER